MDLWATKVNLFTNNTSIKTNTINYITDVLQVTAFHSYYLYYLLTIIIPSESIAGLYYN